MYLAEDPRLNRQVAIKTVELPHAADADEQRQMLVRFLREARTVARLEHHNIVGVYDLLDEGNSVFVVMEYVDGRDLGKLRGRQIEWQLAGRIAVDAAGGLDYAHSKGIVHRDVKPANLLIAESGEVKITDFGIAKIMTASTMTATGLVIGTIEYMSPEQLRGRAIDGRSDQFSLAVIIFQMLTGTRLYDIVEDGPALMYKVLEEIPPLATSMNPELPLAVDEVLARALAKDPDRRFETCGEFARSIEAALASKPNALLPPIPWPSTERGSSGLQAKVATDLGLVHPEEPAFHPPEPVPAPEPEPKPVEKEEESEKETDHPRRPIAGLAIASLIAIGISYSVFHSWSTVPGRTDDGRDAKSQAEENQLVAPPADLQKRVNPKDGLTYVFIPPGTFTMGCSPNDTECDANEQPAHDVTLTKGFWLSETETTQAAYQKVIHTRPSYFKGEDLPVEQVTWEEASSYCKAVGGRLPTEAEWEWAARGGTTRARYGPAKDIGWYSEISNNATHPVKQKAPNYYGLYDMLGNTWEWVADRYGENYYSQTRNRDPQGPPTGSYRVLRGGSWFNIGRFLRASHRVKTLATDRYNAAGFRCALDGK